MSIRLRDDEKQIGVVFRRETLSKLAEVNKDLGLMTSQSVRLAVRDFILKYGNQGGQK